MVEKAEEQEERNSDSVGKRRRGLKAARRDDADDRLTSPRWMWSRR